MYFQTGELSIVSPRFLYTPSPPCVRAPGGCYWAELLHAPADAARPRGRYSSCRKLESENIVKINFVIKIIQSRAGVINYQPSTITRSGQWPQAQLAANHWPRLARAHLASSSVVPTKTAHEARTPSSRAHRDTTTPRVCGPATGGPCMLRAAHHARATRGAALLLLLLVHVVLVRVSVRLG